MPDLKAYYLERELALLRFVAECDLALKDFIEYQLWDGKEVGHVLTKFARAGELEVCHRKNGMAFRGDVTWCRLLPPGLKKIGLEPLRGHNLSQVTTHTRLATHWACHADKRERMFRLEYGEVQNLFGDDRVAPNVPFLLCKDGEDTVVYRVLIATGMLTSVIETTRKVYDEFMTNGAMREHAKNGQLGLLVLCATPEKTATVREALDKKQAGTPAVSALIRVVARLGPSPDSVGRALRNWREERANG